MDLGDLMQLLDDNTNTTIRQRQIFFKTVKKKKESFDEYLSTLQNLAVVCGFSERDNMIRDVILLGMQDKKLRNDLLSKPNLNLDKLISECRSKEVEEKKLEEKIKAQKLNAETKIKENEKLKEFQVTLNELKNCLNQTSEKLQKKPTPNQDNKEKTRKLMEQIKSSRLHLAATAPGTNDIKPKKLPQKDQLEVIHCQKCNSTHPKKSCPNSGAKPKFCYECKGVGHLNTVCPNKLKGNNVGPKKFVHKNQNTKNNHNNKGTPARFSNVGWTPPPSKASQHTWVHKSPYGDIPPHSVHAGHDSDGDPIYVGRSNYNGDWLPAKVIPRKHTAYVCWGGQEIPVTSYEVLCGSGYTWQPGYAGNVPPTAVSAGATTSGELLYVGRGHWQGSLTPGKIHPSHQCLYIPYGGQEVRIDSYEVLVRAPALTWMPSAGTVVPPNAIHAGHDSDGDQIYVGRAHHNGDLLPAKVIVSKGCAYVCHSGGEHMKHQFEILCGTNYRWIPSANGHVPPNSVEGGRTSNGEQLYIGRGHHCGSLTPGKIHPSHQCLYIPYGGQEIRLPNYEVLTRM